jgi:aldehyde dehydrogenase
VATKIEGFFVQGRRSSAPRGHSGELTSGPATVARFESGLFIQPTLFENVRNDMRIAQEEIFGPVTGIFTWDDEAEMLRAVNDSIYGLAWSVRNT